MANGVIIPTAYDGLKSKAARISSGNPFTISYSGIAIVYIYRVATSEYAQYVADDLSASSVFLASGTAPTYVSIANSNKTITVTATAAREYVVVAIYNE